MFPRASPIPIDLLQTINFEKSYHPTCHCPTPPPGSSRDPAYWSFYHGICPHNYPTGLYKFSKNILVVDQDDPSLLHWLQLDSTLPIFSYLSELEQLVYEEFHSFLHFPIVMCKFQRSPKSIDLIVKIFGMAHGVVPVTSSVTLSHVEDIDIDNDSDMKKSWKAQIFFAIRYSLKKNYFDAFLSIHSYLDSFEQY